MSSGLAHPPLLLGVLTVVVTVMADVSVVHVPLVADALPRLVVALATTLLRRMIAVTETGTGIATTTASVVTRATALAARTLGTKPPHLAAFRSNWSLLSQLTVTAIETIVMTVTVATTVRTAMTAKVRMTTALLTIIY